MGAARKLELDDTEQPAPVFRIVESPEGALFRQTTIEQATKPDIAQKIGMLVTKIKEESRSDLGARNANDYEAKREAKRIWAATIIAEEFDIVSSSAELDFSGLYTRAERIASAMPRSAIVGIVESVIEHPAIHTTASLALASDGSSKEDAIVMQRALAIVLTDPESLQDS
jgi:hypothetical protein